MHLNNNKTKEIKDDTVVFESESVEVNVKIGLDIGGTKIAAVLIDDSGRLCAQSWQEHHARGTEDVADALSAVARDLDEGHAASSIGLSVSGLVRRDGSITEGASLEIRGDLAGALAARLGQPSLVFNDAEATLRSVVEAHRAETGEEVHDAILLAIGTGIGGAIIADGRSVRGAAGLATELGHLPMGPATAQSCVCGSSGCLEQYAGGAGIGERARLAIGSGNASDAIRSAHENAPSGITAKHVVQAAREGDEFALSLIDEAGSALARAIRALCVTVEPAIVFLGGTVAHSASDLLLPRITQTLAADWPFASLTSPPPVQLDAIGPYAAAIGAARLAADAALSNSPTALSWKAPTHD